MTSDEIANLWKTDTHIDMTELGAESTKIPQLHSKYLSLLIEGQREERATRSVLQKLTRDKSAYYSGTLDKKTLDYYGWAPFLKKVLKTELKDYLEADKDLQEAVHDHDVAVSKIKQLEEIIKALNGRGYLIKNAIDWMKFQNGVI